MLGFFKLKKEKFRQWLKNDFIRPDILAKGSGRKNYFNKESLYIIALFKRLFDIGLDRWLAELLAHELTHQDWNDSIDDSGIDDIYMVVSGSLYDCDVKNWKESLEITMAQTNKGVNLKGLEAGIFINLSEIKRNINSQAR